MISVRLRHVDELTPTIRSFWFEPERPVSYQAGQFIELTLPHEQPDERGVKRWFTLSSSPTEELLAITTRLSTPSSSFKRTLAALRPGDRLRISQPMGDFVLPKDKTIPLLFIAGGIGITPFRSIVKWLSDANQARRIQLVYAGRDASELVFRDLFEAYGLEFTPVTGKRLTTAAIFNYAAKMPGCLIFIAGPEPMTEAFAAGLQKRGIPNNRLVTDYFPGYPMI